MYSFRIIAETRPEDEYFYGAIRQLKIKVGQLFSLEKEDRCFDGYSNSHLKLKVLLSSGAGGGAPTNYHFYTSNESRTNCFKLQHGTGPRGHLCTM